ncbi:MAG: GNAT family N-acetyltransferase [Candidatus Dormibacteraeota bacterium]|nr:GNAT family N-acetyltransferase [Candidatus Dormibacteraeota bacterium]
MTPHEAPQAIVVRDVQLADVTDLRARVLRSHMPDTPAVAPTDELPDTWHLGAFRGQRLIGTVTAFAEEAPGHPGIPAQRFRFMAVEPSEQGGGAGTSLMAELMAGARARGSRLLWAHGRDTALAFYTGLGFEVVGEAFMDTTSHLPHHVVIRDL